MDESHAGGYRIAGTDYAKSLFESEAITLTVVAPGSLPASSRPALLLIAMSIIAGGAFILAGRTFATIHAHRE